MTDLTPIDVGPRVQRLIDAVRDEGLDALLITSLVNVRWLTGFAGSNATVLLVGDELHLFTDSRYDERAEVELAAVSSGAELHITSKPADELQVLVVDAARVGAEADSLTWAAKDRIESTWLEGRELVATDELVAQLRARKDAAEVARIERAGRIVDHALAEVVSALHDGLSERGFARQLDDAIRRAGADDLGFETIVASGPNGAIPHHTPGSRVIEPGDLVIIDVGARVDGYRSDMTRTFCVGTLTNEQRHHFETVIDAQQAGVDAMQVGARTADVDRAARAVIDGAGWADAFQHGTGHGIGLDIHELPRVVATSDEVYEDGTVATVEPGVYLPGVGGVRIEDTCVATTGGARRLTGYPKAAEV